MTELFLVPFLHVWHAAMCCHAKALFCKSVSQAFCRVSCAITFSVFKILSAVTYFFAIPSPLTFLNLITILISHLAGQSIFLNMIIDAHWIWSMSKTNNMTWLLCPCIWNNYACLTYVQTVLTFWMSWYIEEDTVIPQ